MKKSPENDNGRNMTKEPPPMPRWVKVSGIIVIALVLLFVIKLFFGNGDHGPGRHLPMGEPTEQTEQGMAQ